ncbi:MAG: diaminopimelate decarboxylase [Bacteroidetes bacterium]|nr:diaminopimelate decarboxylase [Bacteroidota bacterium]
MKYPHHIPPETAAAIFRKALYNGLITKDDTAAIFYDLDFMQARTLQLQALFPPQTLHAVAIKANPLIAILRHLRELGMGAEAASIGEVNLALHAGFDPADIVFDSPVKTIYELQFTLQHGIHINTDSLAELDRIDQLLQTIPSTSTIGLRINPQVGLGTIKASSVAGEYSKFGVPLKQFRQEIIQAYQQYPWLSGIHLHIGSQGCPVNMLVEGVKRILHLTEEVNSLRQQINILDVGGGLPVSYDHRQPPEGIDKYVSLLKSEFPQLFSRSYKLITEFGRHIHTNSGFTVSRIEYVKQEETINTAMIHVGADLFLRECLNPSDWSHQYTLLDPTGNPKAGTDKNPYNLAGPLCFSGDILAKNIPLPEAQPGDYLVIHDTGGYTFCMWSVYNSRQMPVIVGCSDSKFTLLKSRGRIEDILAFWGD